RLRAFGFGRRGAARAADYVSFHLAVALAAMRLGQFDLTLALTTPPYVGWTLAGAFRRRAGVRAHWVMDIYPDVLAAPGGLRSRSLLYRWLQALSRWQFAGAGLVLALGPRMLERLRPYVASGTRLEWVPLWGTAGNMPASAAEVRAQRQRQG